MLNSFHKSTSDLSLSYDHHKQKYQQVFGGGQPEAPDFLKAKLAIPESESRSRSRLARQYVPTELDDTHSCHSHSDLSNNDSSVMLVRSLRPPRTPATPKRRTLNPSEQFVLLSLLKIYKRKVKSGSVVQQKCFDLWRQKTSAQTKELMLEAVFKQRLNNLRKFHFQRWRAMHQQAAD